MISQKKNEHARRIRASLIKNGGSLRQWANANNYNLATVYRAVRGDRAGPMSREILAKLGGAK